MSEHGRGTLSVKKVSEHGGGTPSVKVSEHGRGTPSVKKVSEHGGGHAVGEGVGARRGRAVGEGDEENDVGEDLRVVWMTEERFQSR